VHGRELPGCTRRFADRCGERVADLPDAEGLPEADVRASMLDTHWGNPSNHGYIIGSTAALSAAVETALNSDPFMATAATGA